jgi:hypothetical protein
LSIDQEGELPIISFSGGKDSCVLRDLVHTVQEEMKMKTRCISVTGFEIFHKSTEIFIKKNMEEGDVMIPQRKSFASVCREDGYPLISKQLAQRISHVRNTQNHRTYIRATLGLDDKPFGALPLKYCHFLDKKFIDYEISHKCCDYLKGALKHDKRPCFIGTTIEESRLRRNS